MSRSIGLAVRDLRGGLSGLLLLWACLAISVGSIAAVSSLASSIDSALASNGRELLGADLLLGVSQREATAEELEAMQSLGTVAKSVTTRAMAVNPQGRSALVELSGIGPEWPLAGKIEFVSGDRPADGEAAVGQDLAERLGLAVGDNLRLGYANLRVAGIIRSMPATSGFALAPPVLVNEAGLAATGLIQPGSLWTSSYRVVTPPGIDPRAAGERFQQRFPEGGWRATDRSEAAGGTRRFVDRVGQLLLLIALTALAIGGLGIGSAARAFSAARRRTVAVLKLLGGDRRTIAAMLAAEVGLVALVAILLGLTIGALTPSLAAGATEGWLPVAPDPSPQWSALALAAAFGLLVTLAAAWGPVADAVRTRPARVFRQQVDPPPPRSWRSRLVPWGSLLAAAGLAVAASSDRVFTLWILGGLTLLALLFAGLGLSIRRLSRRGAPSRGPLTRLGVAALDRPGAPTVRLSIAMGLGLSLLVMLATVSSSLLKELDSRVADRAPALFLVDIPRAEETRFRALVEQEAPGAELRVAPTLRGQVTAVNGVPVVRMTSIPEGAWILRGDRGLTFTGELPPGNRLVAGSWWPADYSGPPLISLDANAAEALDLKIGDRMTVSVLGRPIEARIASLREIDWRSLGFNFAILFSPGVLESAPYSLMATVAPADPGASTLALERALTRELPMVSAIRVREIIAQVRETLTALDGAVRLATGVAIAIAIVVLAGSVIATRRERQREMVLLKLVGATRGEVLKAQLVEFGLLCSTVTVAAVAAGAIGGWAVMRHLLELPFDPGWEAVLIPPLTAVLLLIGAALLAALPALLVRPATALRVT